MQSDLFLTSLIEGIGNIAASISFIAVLIIPLLVFLILAYKVLRDVRHTLESIDRHNKLNNKR